MLVDLCVSRLSGDHHHHHEDIQNVIHQNDDLCGEKERDGHEEVVAPHCVGCSDDPVRELNEWQQKAEEELQGREDTNTRTSATITSNEIVDDDSGGSPKDGDSD